MRVGQTINLRFIGSNNNFVHPIARSRRTVRGGRAGRGDALAPNALYLANTVNVGPGQRYDVIWTARRAGKWLVHCHIPHHMTNNNVETHGAGGLTMILDVR